MWEVSWNDPGRESKKEYRERKTGERAQREKHQAASRSSTSTRSSSSSSSNKPFTPFSAPRSSHAGSHAGSLTPASSASISSAKGGGPDHDGASTLSTEDSLSDPWYRATAYTTERPPRRDEPITSYQDLPNWPLDISSPTPLAPSRWNSTVAKSAYHCIQTLGPGSIVIKSTEIVVSLWTDDFQSKDFGSSVTITANGFDDVPQLRPKSSGASTQSARPRPAGGLFPRERPSLNALRRVPSWNTTPGTPNSDTWKPPNIWDYKPPVDIPVTSADSPNIAV